LKVREVTETERECRDAWNDQDCWRRVAVEMPEREPISAYMFGIIMGILLGVMFMAYGYANKSALLGDLLGDLGGIFIVMTVFLAVFAISYAVRMAKFLRRLRRAAMPGDSVAG
jgi:Mg/Co/Ni transporter MgtE